MTLEYIRLTKDFEEIKEYVRHKGDTLTGYRQTKEKVSVRIEDILYFETVDGLVFAYTVDSVYEIKLSLKTGMAAQEVTYVVQPLM